MVTGVSWRRARAIGIWVLSTAAVVVGLLVQESGINVGRLIVVIALLLAAGILGGIQTSKTSKEIKDLQASIDTSELRFKTAYHDVLSPLLIQLDELACASKEEAAHIAGSIKQLAISSSERLSGVEGSRVRACLFVSAPVPYRRQLIPSSIYSGRARKPSTKFDFDKPEGRAILALAKSGDVLFEPNLDEHQPDGWNPHQLRDYKTFIAAPVVTGEMLVAMLTVDSPDPGDLREEDKDFIEVLAQVLAISFQMEQISGR